MIKMSNQFLVSESAGEKLFKLITVFFSHDRGMKIISKELLDGKIRFYGYTGEVELDTKEIETHSYLFASSDEGITKEEFNEIVNRTLSEMTEEIEVIIHDLSKYQTIQEKYNKGLQDGFLKIKSSSNA
jgi:hypothetical protein